MTQNERALESSYTALSGLLHAVRRHLWWQHFRYAAELALWTSAALLVIAACTHLLLFQLHLSIVLTTLAIVWIGASIWVATRRPEDSICALWADRHLGGASAFSTRLEIRTRDTPPTPAICSLDAWTRARIPQSLALLARHRQPGRLMQSLVVASMALLITVLVLGLARVQTAGGPHPPVSAPASDEHVALAPPVSAPADLLANELASALRSNEATTRGEQPVTGAPTRTGREDGDSGTPTEDRVLGTVGRANQAPDDRQAGSDVAPGQLAGSSTAANGREAGASRDQRTEPGVSPLLRGPLPGQRIIDAPPSAAPGAERVDTDESSAFDDVDSGSHALKQSPLAVIPAAMPPIDSVASGLSPARAAYVRAWTKALSKNH